MTTLRVGSRGDEVRRLQELLLAAGFDPGGIDGIFGSKTDSAVKAYQQSKGLTADGIVGAKTWETLGGAAAAPAPGAAPAPTAPQSDVDIEAYVRQNYGYVAAFLDIPELRTILLDAAKNKWDFAKLQGAVFGTNFWKTHSQAERDWIALSTQDNAEAVRQWQQRKQEIQGQA